MTRTSHENSSTSSAEPARRSRRGGLWIVGVLAVLTAIGQFFIRDTDASTLVPHPGSPPPDLFSSAGQGISFTGRLDRTAVLRGGDRRVRMELELAAAPSADMTVRMPTDFVVVLDNSGSMTGEKLDYAKAAAQELVSQLLPDDRLALVVFSSGAEVVIPSSLATPDARRRWRSQIASVAIGGGTNMSLGLDTGLTVLGSRTTYGRARRMVLISDGEANEGDPSPEGLQARARRAAGYEAVLTTIGVGAGFNEFLMAALADAGTGNFYFLESTERLASVFSQELAASRETVATALAVTVAPAPGVRVIEAAGYPLEVDNQGVTFRPGSLFAGQQRRIWITFEVPDDHGGPGPSQKLGDQELGRVVLAYAKDGQRHTLAFDRTPRIAYVNDENRFYDSLDRDTWERAVVEDEYNDLQNRVARHVREGHREEALAEIAQYQSSNATINTVVQSETVDRQIQAADGLAAEVEDAFTGANQAQKQNVLSKAKKAAAWDGRRAGSKKVPVVDPGKSQDQP